jgi:hypothetical protein
VVFEKVIIARWWKLGNVNLRSLLYH